ncbi:MAG: RnfABCDGE type electron transport complex subunit B [Candidatus Marinimicrobia bacterium]|nr:RnfABCDGE type electron transport complex subunit B [Candidatus Neomarinimicrobiota bacterium]MCF7827345.1 RnfABCDGE type electron transport complex subunit B [Candidatus Neomarinimicrobiota bacterium]MCF7881422.1 RnfABCDGE type electron transport complex subunit B [Candidatus Neomarinimicrobiota bacterium]
MDVTSLLISMGSMGGLGALFSTGLSIANKKLHVDEDPRISQVKNALPGANCGGCGYPGCAKFAEEVVGGNVEISDCTVASQDEIDEIAEIMGVEVSAAERKIARVMCQGGAYETAKKADYAGIESCLAANLMSGGEKLCEYGCLGFGECVDSCPFDAMYMDDNGLPVVIEEKCTGCGNCVEACPRNVIELHPESDKLFVLCKNLDDPKTSRGLCIKACIGCQICVRAAEDDQMYMDNNLAYVNYDIYGKEPELPTDKCPTGCLVIINGDSAGAEEEDVMEKAA